MWRDGGCLSERKKRQNGVQVSLPACADIWSRERGQAAAPTRKWRTTNSHDVDFDLRRAEDWHALTISFSAATGTSFFVWWSLCQSTGKKLDLFRSVDFEVALGRCDVRTNTVVPVLRLRLGTPWRCCTSRIRSCNGVHALSCSHLCHLSLPLFLDSLISNGGFVLQRGERHFLKLSLSLSLSLSPLHHRVLWQEINQVRGYGFGAQVFFFFFFLIL